MKIKYLSVRKMKCFLLLQSTSWLLYIMWLVKKKKNENENEDSINTCDSYKCWSVVISFVITYRSIRQKMKHAVNSSTERERVQTVCKSWILSWVLTLLSLHKKKEDKVVGLQACIKVRKGLVTWLYNVQLNPCCSLLTCHTHTKCAQVNQWPLEHRSGPHLRVTLGASYSI